MSQQSNNDDAAKRRQEHLAQKYSSYNQEDMLDEYCKSAEASEAIMGAMFGGDIDDIDVSAEFKEIANVVRSNVFNYQWT